MLCWGWGWNSKEEFYKYNFIIGIFFNLTENFIKKHTKMCENILQIVNPF